MVVMEEEIFLKRFILELILLEKDSVFDLDDEEKIIVPRNLGDILDTMTSSDVNRQKYAQIIPRMGRLLWLFNFEKAYQSLLMDDNIAWVADEHDYCLTLNRPMITEMLTAQQGDYENNQLIKTLANNFIIEHSKTKPRVYTKV